MKSLKDFLAEGRKQISDIQGNLGDVLKQHKVDLAKLKNYDQVVKFVESIYDELNDSAKKYADDIVIPEIKRMKGNYIKAYHFLYNIYLAGYTDSRLGIK